MKKIALCFLSIVTYLHAFAGTPLKGTYTIDPKGSGSKNFISFRAAIKAMQLNSIDGKIIFNVADGTYNESLALQSIGANASTDNITFQSKSADRSKVILDTAFVGATVGIYYTSPSCIFKNLTISNSFSGKISGYTSAIYLSSVYGSASVLLENNNLKTINNISWNSTTVFSDNCKNISLKGNHINGGFCSVYISNGGKIKIYDNTIDSSSYGLSASGGDGVDFYNNIVNRAKIYTIWAKNYNIYNNFLSSVYIYGSSNINIYNNSIASASSGAVVEFSDPPYAGAINFVNNNVLNTYGKYAIANHASSLKTCDYNNFYTTGKDIGIVYDSNWKSTTCSTLSDWRTATKLDAHSISSAPGFYNVNGNDLHLTNQSIGLMRKGTSLSQVSDDIDGDSRGSNPDIGADELKYYQLDAGIIAIDTPSPVFCSGKHNFYARLFNPGFDTLTTDSIGWSINDTAGKVYYWKGKLAPLSSIYIKLGSPVYTVASVKKIKVWSYLPNGKNDMNTANDTFTGYIGTGLSGKYTIKKGVSTSTTFPGFNAVSTTLATRGICGAVTINVTDGTYNESLTLNAIPGTSPSNTILFQSSSGNRDKVILDTTNIEDPWYGRASVIRLNSVSYISFKKMTIWNSRNDSSGHPTNVLFTGYCHHITFDGNYMRVNPATLGSNMDDWNFSDSVSNLTLKNNYFVSKGGISIFKLPYLNISNNRFDSGTTGIFLGNVVYGGYITGNSIFIRNGSNALRLGAYSPSFNKTNFLKINNNFITVLTSNTWPVGVFSSINTDIANNTIVCSSPSPSLFYEVMGSNNSCTLNNNILINSGSGCALEEKYYNSYYYSILSDNNNLFSNGKFLAAVTGYGPGDYGYFTSLGEWHKIKSDINSISINPVFKSLQSGDLHLTDSCASFMRKGIAISDVKTDIDGQKRGKTPILGADEIHWYSLDAGVTALDSPSTGFCGGNHNVYARIYNAGKDTLTSLKINWSIDDTLQTPVMCTDSILPLLSISVKLGSCNLNLSGRKIKIWTSNTNGGIDSIPINDTLEKHSSFGMSGNYIISKTNGDFASFHSAIKTLEEKGVCGQVTINVEDGKYNESNVMHAIPGSSLKNTIIFQSKSGDSSKVIMDTAWTMNYYSRTFTLHLDSASFITFRRLTLAAHPDSSIYDFKNAHNGDIISLSHNSSYNRFENNRITGVSWDSVNGGACVMNIPSVSSCHNNMIRNNLISGLMTGIRLDDNVKFDSIIGNSIDSTITGMYLNNTDSVVIAKNKILLPKGQWGIYYYGNSGGVICNNFITILGKHAIGLYTSNANVGGIVCYNSIYTTISDTTQLTQYKYPASFVLGTMQTIKNNIFMNNGVAPSVIADPARNLNNNCYFSKSSRNMMSTTKYGKPLHFASLADWVSVTHLDSQSINSNPVFTDPSKGDLSISNSSPVISAGKAFHLIRDDIFYKLRPYDKVDIGAHQLSYINNDVGVSFLPIPTNKKCIDSISSLSLRISNYGVKEQSNFNLTIFIDGPSSASAKVFIAGSIQSGKDSDINVKLSPALNTHKGGYYTILAFTDLTSDQVSMNDSLKAKYDFKDGLEARFAKQRPGCAGDITFFIDSSKINKNYGSIKSYLWDFGNGKTSDKQDAFTVFMSPKTYSVTLNITSSNGCKDSLTKTISIDTADARFKCSPDTNGMKFSALSSNIYSYLWDFGDSTRESTKNPVHLYSQLNKYKVTLRIFTYEGCQAMWSDSINAILGIEDANHQKLRVSIYPNPLKDGPLLIKSKDFDDFTIKLTDITGRNLYEDKYTNTNQISLEMNYPTGIYLLTIYNKNGAETFKVVKE